MSRGERFRVQLRDKVVFATQHEAIELGIEKIVALANIEVLRRKSDEEKAKIEEAVRGLMDAYAEEKCNAARLDELKRVADEVGLFTRRRVKEVYQVYLPLDYLVPRLKVLRDRVKAAV